MESIPRHLWRTSLTAAPPAHSGSGGWAWLVPALIAAAALCWLLAAIQRRRGK